MDSKAILDGLGRVLKEHRERVERMIAAVRVTRVERTSEVAALLVFGDGSTHSLELPKGERGERGERGEPGQATALKGDRGERGEPGGKGERGDPGERGEAGIGIRHVEAGRDGEAAMFIFDDGRTATIPLPAGKPGERGAPGTNGERGERGADGIGVECVEQGEDDPDSFTLKFTNGEAVEVRLPRGETGERGMKGEDGEPGRDRFIAAPRFVSEGESILKNDLVAWGGGIMQAIRATNHTPDHDPASYVCIVAGIASFSIVENMEQRSYDIHARMTDGVEQVARFKQMPRLMADGPRPGERIIKGDQIVRGDWLYTALLDDVESVSPEKMLGWRRQNIRGKRGEDGARGARGERGIGIADVALDDEAGVLTVRLTSGEEKVFDAQALLGRVST